MLDADRPDVRLLVMAESSTRIANRMAPKISGGILLALVLATGTAHGQTPAPSSYPPCSNKPLSKGESDAAHYAYLAGRQSFDEGDYATAITYFKDAYRRDCTKHELLPIIARANELTQNRAEALLALETFLKRAPANDPNVEPVKKRLANLRSQGGDSKSAAAAPAPATATPATSTTPSNAGQAPVATDLGSSSSSSSSSSSTTPAPEPRRSPSVVPWIVTGAGVVAAVVGTVVLVGGLDKQNDATAACPKSETKGRTCPPNVDAVQTQKDFDDGKSQATMGGIVMGVGAAAVVGGVVWMLIDRNSVANASALAPWVGPNTAGLGWSKPF